MDVEEQPVVAAVLDRNRAAAIRIGRIISAGAGLGRVLVQDDPLAVSEHLSEKTRLLAVEPEEVELALRWVESRCPAARVITWARDRSDGIFRTAAASPALAAVLGWPDFSSGPRPWELAMAARRAVEPQEKAPAFQDYFRWGVTQLKWRPHSTADLASLVQECANLASRAGVADRAVERVSETAHELLMNAMYDAPVDAAGKPRFAHARDKQVVLSEKEAPTFRFGTDGSWLGLEVTDPFGGLARKAIWEGLARTLAPRAGGDAARVLDTSHGGAGLGIMRMYSNSAVLVFDVARGRHTRVTALMDLDLGAREWRGLPCSVHFLDSQAP